jgi:predicted nucleic acid-binding protein
MKGFFDTSVLVAVFYGDHVHHKSSLGRFVRFHKSTGCCGAHSLVEVYSTLTRMPGKHRIAASKLCCSSAAYVSGYRSSHWPEMNTPMRCSPPLRWAS